MYNNIALVKLSSFFFLNPDCLQDICILFDISTSHWRKQTHPPSARGSWLASCRPEVY